MISLRLLMEAGNDNNQPYCEVLFREPVYSWHLTLVSATSLERFLFQNQRERCCGTNYRHVYTATWIDDRLGP